MINWDKSATLNEMGIEELKQWVEKYPSSAKRVITVCDSCNEEREIYFNAYRGLCKRCAMNKESTVKTLRAAAIHQWNIPDARDRQSETMLQYNKEHPEKGEAHSRFMIKHCEDPKVLDAMSERAIQYHIDHPEVAKDHGEKMKKSEAAKYEQDRQRGGNDIIQHHYLYDDSDLSKNTMLMTRSEHGKMHRRMQLDGYEVPHINSDADDNGLWGYAQWYQ